MDNDYSNTNYRSFYERYNYGRQGELFFLHEWITNYKCIYGILLKEDGIDFDWSVPDLRMNVDVKWKTPRGSKSTIESNEIWFACKSVDVMKLLQRRNIDYNYIYVVHLYGQGWLGTNAKDIPTTKIVDFRVSGFPAHGSREPMYSIPLRKFEPLKDFLKQGEWIRPWWKNQKL